jgi:hypothetical protein
MTAYLKHIRFAFVAEVIRLRPLGLSLAGIGLAQVIAGSFHVGFPCAFHAATGLPCPGCGLTRSCMALLHGHPKEAFLLHPFGPVALGTLIFCLVGCLLPDRPRRRLALAIERLEVDTGLFPMLLLAFVLLWVLRISHALPLTPV